MKVMKAKFNIKKLIKNIIILAIVVAVVILGVYITKNKKFSFSPKNIVPFI